MKKRKIFGALAAATVFVLLMMLFDRNTSPETFGKGNYWLKPLVQGLLMFFVYLLPNHVKDSSWKDLFRKYS